MKENISRNIGLRWWSVMALASFASRAVAQEASPSPSPTPTPPLYSTQTLAELKQLQQAALKSDYAYRQVAHLSNNIGPRLTGSAQAQKAVEYVAAELKAIGLEVQLEKITVPHWVRGEETAAWIDTLSDEFLAEPFTQPQGMTPPTKSRFEMIMSMKEHEMHHRGQLMLVERLIGIVPHLTRQMQERFAAARQVRA